MDDCPFCDYAGPNPILADLGPVIVFEPLRPVTEGHVLVVPKRHVEDATELWDLTGDVFALASYWASERNVGPCNLITSVGREATQSVMHLHVHVVPRRDGDGLALPWTHQL